MDYPEIEMILIPESFRDLFHFIKPEEAVIDKNRNQSIADSLMDKDCKNGRIDAPAQGDKILSSPTISWILRTSCSIKDPIVQLGLQPQTLNRKFRRMVMPWTVCVTSGWNCTPKNPALAFSMAAFTQLEVEPITWKSFGSFVM